jgi:protein-S-isoprenylcysteine O-methyltransferase Ste14
MNENKESQNPTETPNRLPWPPMIYLSAVGVALLADIMFTLPWLTGGVAVALQILGAALGVGALGMDVVAARVFHKHQTTILPNKGATTLITTGPFAWSRNPIYVGNTVLVIAAGLYFGKLWLLLVAPVAAYLTQKLAIEREEHHLAARFGEDWRAYAAKVRRWL